MAAYGYCCLLAKRHVRALHARARRYCSGWRQPCANDVGSRIDCRSAIVPVLHLLPPGQTHAQREERATASYPRFPGVIPAYQWLSSRSRRVSGPPHALETRAWRSGEVFCGATGRRSCWRWALDELDKPRPRTYGRGLDLAPQKRAIARPPWEAYATHAAPRYTCLRDCSRHDSSSLTPPWSAVGGMLLVRQGLTAPRVDGKRCTTPGATNNRLAPGIHALPAIQSTWRAADDYFSRRPAASVQV